MSTQLRRLVWLALAAGLLIGAGAPAPGDLEAGFANPPQDARLRCYWWWLNGNVTKQAITRDLEQMKAKGFGGAIIVDAGGADQRGHAKVPAGPTFGSPPWRELYRHALGEANRLGLELSLNILSGWNLGGPNVQPENAAKLAVWSQAQIRGPARLERTLDVPQNKLGYYRDVAVLAYPLQHGMAPRSEPIRMLNLKASFEEFGMSTPETAPLLSDVPSKAGEEDALSGQVVDLSAKMDTGGKLTWDVPAGDWEILRFGYAASGATVSTSSDAWQGLAIDYLSRSAFESYWNDVVAPLIADAGPYLGKALKYLVTDSWELGGVNWTAGFREEFRQRRGYDLLPYLPVLTGRIVDSREVSSRFLNDFRRTIGDLVAYRHYAVFEELARRHGLGIHPEAGGPHGAPLDALLSLGIGAFPQMEFWARAATHRVRDDERFFVKEAASAAHIYGKTIVAAEGLTSIGPQWEETIWDNLKPSFDRAVTEGLNLLIWHTFTSSPAEMGVPGQEYFAGTHFNPNITWWPQAGAFLSYINRTQFLQQQGLFVADALYYYGDQVPNFVRLKAADPAHVLPGYDYDVCDLNTLLNRTAVKDGRIVLPDGMSYRLLALPDLDVISPAALRKVRDLVRAGATVLGPRPARGTSLTGYPQSDAEVAQLAGELWGPADGNPAGERRSGQGRVIWGRTARDSLAKDGVPPDFEFAGAAPGADFDYIHRRTGDADLYFVSNRGDRAEILQARFRVSGKSPELWLPETGEIRPQVVYDFTTDGRTSLPLRLEPYGAVFVVFRKAAAEHVVLAKKDGQQAPWIEVFVDRGGAPAMAASESGRYTLKTSRGRTLTVTVPRGSNPLPVTGPWTVRFPKGWGAPESTVFSSLESWPANRDPGIRYFSGTAVYEKEVDIPAAMLGSGKSLVLDLGEVHEVAEVDLNGKSLGVIWGMPRTVDVTAAAITGRNRLTIRVTNLWPNRLIGDQLLPEAERFTRTNIRKFTKDSPLLPSGLLGPVILRSVAFARPGALLP